MDQLYTKGTRVWLSDREEVWTSAKVLSYTPNESILVRQEDNGKEKTIVLKEGKSGGTLPPLRNPDILTMENNLTTMSYLHEPAVLHSLRKRFTESRTIYTYCGIVLVAINPYQDIPLYGNEMIWAYKDQQIGQLDPHIYAISEDAYSEMTTLGRNQSIIVSGESGAGKTVSAKYAMRYFATVAGNEQETAIERRILSTNPIMEALGNAKTIRNDNSSRFGKYVELEFDRSQNIVGAHICTYLLEKSRVVFQAADERNYHILYQLCAVRDLPEMARLHLRHPDEFHFTRQGAAPTIDHVDDTEQFYEMSEAMFNLGISEEQQMFLYSVLAGILHMGNITISEERNDSCSISSSDEHLLLSAELLGLEVESLRKWLCHKTLKARNETVVMGLKKKDAEAGLSAFAKHIYASCFLWIVKLLNNALSCTKNNAVNFIGILDIYGFEMFEENSFEQFCINYANEKLQQQFNQHVFKLEQAEYVREEITWSFIDFYDNQPCIDLIERKLGIIDLLDEQCRMNRGTDENWVQILYKQHKKCPHFQKPKTGTDQFVIVHYADKVSYSCSGFIAKNLDAVNDSHIALLRESKLEEAVNVFADAEHGVITSPKKVPAAKLRKQTTSTTLNRQRTVGAQFKTSLNLLMDALSTTVPHFIRCIKPNDDKESFGFVPMRVVQQLRACGVIETVRISAAGYPSRWSYTEFNDRYSLLLHSSQIRKGDVLGNCKAVLTSIVSDEDKYQFGKSKIFFRAGQVALFERLRSERQLSACVSIQAHVRGWLAGVRYRRLRAATLLLQRLLRGTLARRRAQAEREKRASTAIQRHVRGWMERQRYGRLQRTALFLQCAYRANIARARFLQVKYDVKARIIQKHIRGWLARCAYRDHVAKIVKIQSCVRRHLAKKQLKALKVEARSIGHFKKLNVKLEKRIFELQMKNKSMLNEHACFVEDTQQRLEEFTAVKRQLDSQAQSKAAVEKELKDTAEELKDLRKEHLKLKLELSKRTKDEEEITELKARVAQLEADLAESKAQLEQEETKNTERHEEMERSMAAEIASEREHHQKLVIENSNLLSQLQELQTIAELKEQQETMVAEPNGDSHNLPVDENERKRLEEIIIENVQLKEDLDRTTDELMDAIDEQALLRSKFDELEGRLSGVRDALVRDIGNTRNPRQAQDKIRSHLDQLRVALFSDIAKFKKFDIKTEEDAVLQDKVETLAGENIRLLDEISKLQNALPSFLSGGGGGSPNNKNQLVRQESYSAVRQKKQDFRGMLACRKSDDSKLVKKLITQLRTEHVTGVGCVPGLTAHLMFMCVRYADHCNDETRIQELLTAIITGITAVTRKQSKDPVISTFWLSNCLTLLHDLTQFSGEEPYHGRISAVMQEFALKNYDLSDYRNLLSDQCVNIYHTLVKCVQADIQPMLVPGMLEHDSIPGMNTTFSGVRKQSKGGYDTVMLVNRLQFYLQLMTSQHVSPVIVRQLFRQVLYYLNATLLNNLILRKDLCHWSKGIQIRYNLSQVEQWVREQNLDLEDTDVLSALNEIRQASQLLQMNKSTVEHAAAIAETCFSLNTLQLQKLLVLYSPSSEFEERVPQSVIKYILNYRPIAGGAKLMLDPNKMHTVNFTYQPFEVDFTLITPPSGLRLNFLEKF